MSRTKPNRPPASAPDVTVTLLVEQAFTPGLARRRTNDLQKIYTALLTADLAAAEGWYTKLLGRGPDNRPMKTLVQWELFDQGGLALFRGETFTTQSQRTQRLSLCSLWLCGEKVLLESKEKKPRFLGDSNSECLRFKKLFSSGR